MSKMHYFSDTFQKSSSAGGFPLLAPLTFDVGDLKLRDLDKLCFSNWLWRNRT